MTKHNRVRLTAKPLNDECYRARISGIELYDNDGNGYMGCFGYIKDHDYYLRECLNCGAWKWNIAENNKTREVRL